jgi:hypothetical protein
MLGAALKYLTKLGKWSDRLLQDYQRVLNSNRWRIGNWLSFKRADEKSKEAQRLAQLIASRPEPGSGARDPAQVQSSTGKGALPNLDNRSAGPASAAAGSSMAARASPFETYLSTLRMHSESNPHDPRMPHVSACE